MMEEVFEIIKVVNILADRITDLSKKTDSICKSLKFTPKEYWDEQDAADYLQMSKRSLARLRSKHRIKFICSNRHIRYRPCDLDEYLEQFCLRQ